MSGPLGEKVLPKPPPPPPEWQAHPTDTRFQVNRQGQLRTAIPEPT